MTEGTDFIARAILIGVGATALLDLWSFAVNRAFGVPSPNWGLIGRWIGYFPRGRFVHHKIADAAPVGGELAIGWAAHYAIGVGFATLLLVIAGFGWARQPTLLPALIFGIATVAAPFFILQPGMGNGIAASKTPNLGKARLRSLLTHAVFGLCLYGATLLSSLLIRS